MTNKLDVIINSLKVPKIKKILLYEIKFLVPNYSCLQSPWLGATTPRSQFCLSSVLNWICWTSPPPNKIPGYATATERDRWNGIWLYEVVLHVSLIKQQSVVTHWYTVLQETEKTWQILHTDQQLSMWCFYENTRRNNFFVDKTFWQMARLLHTAH